MEVDPNVICSNCKSTGHKSSRSSECPNHISSKLEVMNRNLGTNFQTFTRKVPFDDCVKDDYKGVLKNKIMSTCEAIRQIVFRAQLFVNYYVVLHSDEIITASLYQQSFWYSVCQLVNNRRVTNGNGVSSGLIGD